MHFFALNSGIYWVRNGVGPAFPIRIVGIHEATIEVLSCDHGIRHKWPLNDFFNWLRPWPLN